MNDRDREGVEPVGVEGYDMPTNGNQVNVKALIAPIVLSVGLVFAVLYAFIIPKLVSRADFDANIGTVVTEMDTVKTSVTALGGVPAQISALSTSIGTARSELATFKSSVDGYATEGSVASLQSSVTTLQSSVAILQAELNTLKANVGGSPELEAKVVGLQASLDSLVKEISAVQTRVATLESGTSSTTPSTGGGTTTGTVLASDTLNGVTATIEPYSYSFSPITPYWGNMGNEAMSLMIGDTGEGFASFQLLIENANARSIQDIVLGLSLGIFDIDFKPQPVVGTGVTLSSRGSVPRWMPQPTGVNSILSYSGGSYGFFNFSQSDRERTYICNISVDNVSGLSEGTYYLYPQIKVISFGWAP